MWKRKKESKGAGDLAAIYDKSQKLIAEYESTQAYHLLDEMKVIKPQLQEAVSAMAALCSGHNEVKELKAVLAMAYNSLGGLSLYLQEYSEAWDFYETSRHFALESRVAREIVQATNNLGTVALKQGDFDVALEQFEMAASYCSDLSSEDKWMGKQIERNIEMAKRKLGQ